MQKLVALQPYFQQLIADLLLILVTMVLAGRKRLYLFASSLVSRIYCKTQSLRNFLLHNSDNICSSFSCPLVSDGAVPTSTGTKPL